MSARSRFRRAAKALVVLAAGSFLLACASGASDGGSNTNWLTCRVDTDCLGHQQCIAAHCTSVDAGSNATDPALQLDAARSDSGAVCSGDAAPTDLSPEPASLLDVYLMVDQSGSMTDVIPGSTATWWSALESGIAGFVNAPRETGMAVGIQYFPLDGTAPASCSADYSTPDVEIGPLPANAAAVAASIDAHQPRNFTPTGPALTGAIAHMKAWARSHPGRTPVVVLVTDGFPTECDPQKMSDLATIAQTGFDTEPHVHTFVVGLKFGVNGSNLTVIAQAGGSGSAILISSGDIATELTTSLLSIAVLPECATKPVPPSQ